MLWKSRTDQQDCSGRTALGSSSEVENPWSARRARRWSFYGTSQREAGGASNRGGRDASACARGFALLVDHAYDDGAARDRSRSAGAECARVQNAPNGRRRPRPRIPARAVYVGRLLELPARGDVALEAHGGRARV